MPVSGRSQVFDPPLQPTLGLPVGIERIVALMSPLVETEVYVAEIWICFVSGKFKNSQ